MGQTSGHGVCPLAVCFAWPASHGLHGGALRCTVFSKIAAYRSVAVGGRRRHRSGRAGSMSVWHGQAKRSAFPLAGAPSTRLAIDTGPVAGANSSGGGGIAPACAPCGFGVGVACPAMRSASPHLNALKAVNGRRHGLSAGCGPAQAMRHGTWGVSAFCLAGTRRAHGPESGDYDRVLSAAACGRWGAR